MHRLDQSRSVVTPCAPLSSNEAERGINGGDHNVLRGRGRTRRGPPVPGRSLIAPPPSRWGSSGTCVALCPDSNESHARHQCHRSRGATAGRPEVDAFSSGRGTTRPSSSRLRGRSRSPHPQRGSTTRSLSGTWNARSQSASATSRGSWSLSGRKRNGRWHPGRHSMVMSWRSGSTPS